MLEEINQLLLSVVEDWKDNLHPNSKIVKEGVKLEPSLKNVKAGEFFQFERKGYFSVDPDLSK